MHDLTEALPGIVQALRIDDPEELVWSAADGSSVPEISLDS